eukprot:366004-Chlamydomonas_euryale.AAC.6
MPARRAAGEPAVRPPVVGAAASQGPTAGLSQRSPARLATSDAPSASAAYAAPFNAEDDVHGGAALFSDCDGVDGTAAVAQPHGAALHGTGAPRAWAHAMLIMPHAMHAQPMPRASSAHWSTRPAPRIAMYVAIRARRRP